MATYEEHAQRLDLDYVRSVGEAVRSRLFPSPSPSGAVPLPMPVGISYQPGNGAAYDLLFVAVRSIQQAGIETRADRQVPSEAFQDERPLDGYVIISRTNGADTFSRPFDLSFGRAHYVGYVGESLGLSVADASALTALLRAISGVNIIDEPVVTSSTPTWRTARLEQPNPEPAPDDTRSR